MQEIKRVVIVGPESTGKSTLCQLLAARYRTIGCAEYAREYLLNNGTNYTYNDLLTIAKGQLLLQEQAEKSIANGELPIVDLQLPGAVADLTMNAHQSPINMVPSTSNIVNLLFIDTDMYVMKVWCEYVFGKCHQFILDEIVQHEYHLYLLCKPDIPWVKDELREYPDEQTRIELYHIYRDLLINQSVPWAEVSGSFEERLHKATAAVDKILC